MKIYLHKHLNTWNIFIHENFPIYSVATDCRFMATLQPQKNVINKFINATPVSDHLKLVFEII